MSNSSPSSSSSKKPQKASIVFFPEKISQSNQSMVDLHGSSQEKAKESVQWHLQMAKQMNIESFRFVTGRGNHVNSRGERGTLYREFPSWLSKEDCSKVSEIRPCNGYYEVKLKKDPRKKPFPIALEDINRQWIETNIETIKSLADQGDDFFQFLLGDCFYYGIGITQDYKKAVKYYQKAHEQHNDHATYTLGGCYWQGKGVIQNDEEAITLFKEGAKNDFPWAHHQLGDIYEYGAGASSDPAKAFYHYEKASKHLDLAKRKTAHAYQWGKGIPPDEKMAFSLYKEVADRGDSHSAYNVAVAYLRGNGTNINIPQAFHYAKQSAQEDPDAQFLLFELYHMDRGPGAPPNPEQAFQCLKEAASNHQKHALFMIAFHPQTKSEERTQYIIQAAKAGQVVAQAFVLEVLPANLLTTSDRKSIEESFWAQEDEEITRNMPTGHYQALVLDAYIGSEHLTRRRKEKILRLLNTLVSQKNSDAILRLGNLYRTGEKGLVQKEASMTEKLWLEGTTLQCRDCFCSLGYLYEERGDKDKAFSFFKEGADRESANCHNQMGLYYEYGTGTPPDAEKAEWHYKQAMRLDSGQKKLKQKNGLAYVPTYPNATYNLSRLYFKQKRQQEGLLMLTASAQAGDTSAKKHLQAMGIPEERIKNLAHQVDVAEEKSSTTNVSSTPRTLLNAIADALSLSHNWNITKENKAWCYIPKERTKEIGDHAIIPMVIRNTQDGRIILLLEQASIETLEQIHRNLMTEQSSNAYHP